MSEVSLRVVMYMSRKIMEQVMRWVGLWTMMYLSRQRERERAKATHMGVKTRRDAITFGTDVKEYFSVVGHLYRRRGSATDRGEALRQYCKSRGGGEEILKHVEMW